MSRESSVGEDGYLHKATLIMTNGRVLWDWVFKVQADHLSNRSPGDPLKDISVAQYHLLSLIRQLKTASISQIAQALDVSAPSASAMVDRLVEKGVLLRQHSRQDRRKVEISLSPRVLLEILEVEQAILESFTRLVQELGWDETCTWCEVLQKVTRIVDRQLCAPSGSKLPAAGPDQNSGPRQG